MKKLPKVITHKNMGPILDAISREAEFQPGFKGPYKKKAWYRKIVKLEFPIGELAKGWLQTVALVGPRPDYELKELTGKEGFVAHGLEGKAVVEKELFGALMNLRMTLPSYRGRILT